MRGYEDATGGGKSQGRGWLRRALTAMGRGFPLTGAAIVEACSALWIALSVTLVCVGVGVYLVPGSLDGARSLARRQRRRALAWSDVPVEEFYAPLDERTHGLAADWRRTARMLTDTATWWDLLWVLVNPVVGPCIALLSALGLLDGLWGLSMPFLWRTVSRHWNHSWFGFIPLTSQLLADLAAVAGAAEIVVALLLARPMLRLHGRWVQLMLGRPSRALLIGRADYLTRSRTEAVDAQAAELRRIERDLHDVGQARLVAMGMAVSAAQNLIERDPKAANAILAEVKDNSAKALQELRDLVRGIHPPVLADRGLVDAVRELALESPLPVEVESDLDGRVSLPIESAAYFAVAELLNNAVKYARATSLGVQLRYSSGMLRIHVHDDGVGGANRERGTGLRGIERRLSPFDGQMTITSPAGGPTVITLAIPADLTADSR